MHHIRPAFPAAGEAEDVGCRHKLRHFPLSDVSYKLDVILQTGVGNGLVDASFVLSLGSSRSGDQQARGNAGVFQGRQGMHDAMVPLALNQCTRGQDHLLMWGDSPLAPALKTIAGMKHVRVDAVRYGSYVGRRNTQLNCEVPKPL